MRYVTRPKPKRPTRGYFDGDDYMADPMISNVEVDDVVIVSTGILDQYGDEIFRVPDPIGFHNPLED